jgi:hypothetical protein
MSIIETIEILKRFRNDLKFDDLSFNVYKNYRDLYYKIDWKKL